MISIIIPVYNAEKYLDECLESVLRQTYKDYEVWLIDDGSIDNSGMICDMYVDKYKNFHVIHKDNQGLGIARNTGLEHIKGEFVTFLDSDDYWKNDMLESLYELIVSNNVDVCKTGFSRVDDKHNIMKNIVCENRLYEGSESRTEFLPRMIGARPDAHDSIEMAVCACMYKTSVIFDNNIKFKSERQFISEDLLFNIEYMQYSKGAISSTYIGYFYRVNQGSLTTVYRSTRFEACKSFYKYTKNRLIELKYNDSVYLRLDRMFFINIRMCIVQERKKISHHLVRNRINNIKKICNDEVVQETIKNYPLNKIGIKQRIFLLIIKNKMVHILDILNEIECF